MIGKRRFAEAPLHLLVAAPPRWVNPWLNSVFDPSLLRACPKRRFPRENGVKKVEQGAIKSLTCSKSVCYNGFHAKENHPTDRQHYSLPT